MRDPLVSIMMITYNHALFISQAIEGVLTQRTNFGYELIIGEDCSNDGTREKVLKHSEKHPDIIKVITSNKNLGMRHNAFRTAKACRAKYVAFCEGDDYWHDSNKLQQQVDYLESHPDCGMISTDVNIHYQETRRFKYNYNFQQGFNTRKHLSIEEILWGGLPIWTCTVMIRGSIYHQIIDSDLYLHQSKQLFVGDLQVWAEASMVSEITYIPETLATYRVLNESASRSKDRRKELRFLKSLSDIKIYLSKKYSLSEEFLKKEEVNWADLSLLLAMYERDAALADEVRRRSGIFTTKERFRFLAAKFALINYGYRAAQLLLSPLRKKPRQWP